VSVPGLLLEAYVRGYRRILIAALMLKTLILSRWSG